MIAMDTNIWARAILGDDREALALSGGSVGLSDNLIAMGARARGCSKLLTFDARFARSGRAELLKA